VWRGWRQVAWQRPAGSLLSYFFRLYQKADGDDRWLKVYEGKDDCEYQATALQPNRTYHFRCQSFGMAGDGPFCEPVACCTAVGVPRLAPQNLRATHVTVRRG
jgi:hypothetical protein